MSLKARIRNIAKQKNIPAQVVLQNYMFERLLVRLSVSEVYITDNMDLLDIGGIANTIYEVVTSGKFIKKVKRDFIFGEYDVALAAL